MQQYVIFVGVTPGFEGLLRKELEGFGFSIQDSSCCRGGIELETDLNGLWSISLRSRLAESLRLRLGRFRAEYFSQLRTGLEQIPWEELLPAKGSLELKVTAQRSRLYHTGAVEERARKVIEARREGKSGPVSKVHLRITKDIVQVSLDASGDRLHRRGYRVHVGKAPLRETLAAGCLMASKLPSLSNIWDPFCGSGTFLIEAAGIERGHLAATTTRRFAFEDWHSHKPEQFAALRKSLSQELFRDVPVQLFGSDIDAAEIKIAKSNAARAGVSQSCTFLTGDFDEIADQIPEGCSIITNLPYGLRGAPKSSIRETYERLGSLLWRRPDLRPAVVLSGNLKFRQNTGFRWKPLLEFQNGGLRVELISATRTRKKRRRRT